MSDFEAAQVIAITVGNDIAMLMPMNWVQKNLSENSVFMTAILRATEMLRKGTNGSVESSTDGNMDADLRLAEVQRISDERSKELHPSPQRSKTDHETEEAEEPVFSPIGDVE